MNSTVAKGWALGAKCMCAWACAYVVGGGGRLFLHWGQQGAVELREPNPGTQRGHSSVKPRETTKNCVMGNNSIASNPRKSLLKKTLKSHFIEWKVNRYNYIKMTYFHSIMTAWATLTNICWWIGGEGDMQRICYKSRRKMGKGGEQIIRERSKRLHNIWICHLLVIREISKMLIRYDLSIQMEKN